MAVRPTLPWPAILAGKLLVIVAVLAVGVAGAYVAFLWYPQELVELIGVVLLLVVGVAALRAGGTLAGRIFPGYNVGEVAVEGPIARDGGGMVPSTPGQPGADEIVEQIEQANTDPAVQGLLVKLNTPGGQVVPSDDIRSAVEAFDGPVIAYATDVCASGGYWIASGCDELWARDASIVGSIGVLGSRFNLKELADRLGISYERFTAGAYKDAGSPFREIEDDEREYLQGLVDDYYDHFIDRVTEGRDLEDAEVRGTEARVYLGEEAHEIGLVDELGDAEDVEDAMADRLDLDDVRVRAFEPQIPFTQRLRIGLERVAYAAGTGLADRLVGDEVPLPDRP